VDSEVLLAGNSRLQATESVSQVAGPGAAGAAIQLLRAPFALLVDAVSFLFSATMLASIRRPEPAPERAPAAAGERWLRGIRRDIRSGLSFTFGHPILRPLAAADATFNFFAQLMLTLFVLYAARVSDMSASQIGVVFAAFGLGGVVAAAALGRVVARLGYGRLLLAGYAVGALAITGLPFVTGSALMRTVLYGLLFFIAGCGIIALNIATMTLRQVATPNAMQGRVTAAYGFLIGAHPGVRGRGRGPGRPAGLARNAVHRGRRRSGVRAVAGVLAGPRAADDGRAPARGLEPGRGRELSVPDQLAAACRAARITGVN
jgi:Major Facilitator Superfamily